MQDEKKAGEEKDLHFMKEALKEAHRAIDQDEVPVGAVIVYDGQVIARGYNYVEHLNDVTAHAEMQCITSATNRLGAKYLDQCEMFVTLEPCPMCAGALFHSRIKRLVYGAGDPKNGFTLLGKSILHPKTVVQSGVMGDDCADLLISFFSRKRT